MCPCIASSRSWQRETLLRGFTKSRAHRPTISATSYELKIVNREMKYMDLLVNSMKSVNFFLSAIKFLDKGEKKHSKILFEHSINVRGKQRFLLSE